MKIAGLVVAVVSLLIAGLSLINGGDKGQGSRVNPPVPSPHHQPGEAVTQVVPEVADSQIKAVPLPFVGTWVGLVDDEDLDTPFPVEIQIQKGGLGQTVGKVKYETFDCRGVIRLYEVSSRELSVQERIADGDHSCDEDLVILEYRPNGTLHYSYNDGEARGTLSKKTG
ncbi:hypothetical protein ACIBEJ_44960 [Nonomuraea sp. NPDC050790]|uniref:hypothetical protein n=1 Tax=Nonomuraea sp. NPDC050790 TaxID=3364371 RepID=UPI0037AAF316